MRNEMMHRPVVKPELVAFMREKQKCGLFAVFIGTASAKRNP